MGQGSGLKLPPEKIWLYAAVGRLLLSRTKGKPQTSTRKVLLTKKEQWPPVLDRASYVICGNQCKMEKKKKSVRAEKKQEEKHFFFFLPLSLSQPVMLS